MNPNTEKVIDRESTSISGGWKGATRFNTSMTRLLGPSRNKNEMEFSMEVIEETKSNDIRAYTVEGDRGDIEFPIFSLYKAYREERIDQRYVILNCNQTVYFLVDCKTGKSTRKIPERLNPMSAEGKGHTAAAIEQDTTIQRQ